MKFDSVDKVIVNQGEIVELFKWKDKNKDLVRAHKPIMLEGLIIFQNLGAGSFIYFKHDKEENQNLIRYQLFMLNKKFIDFKYNRNTWAISNQWFNKEEFVKIFHGMNINEAVLDVLSTHSTLMAFIENYENEIIIKEEVKQVKNTVKKINNNKQNKKYKKTNKLIKSKQFIIPKNIKEVLKKIEKREYERHCEAWHRKGYWRKHRDSQGNITKRVWVKPTKCYAKGKQGKIEGKTYILGIKKEDN